MDMFHDVYLTVLRFNQNGNVTKILAITIGADGGRDLRGTVGTKLGKPCCKSEILC